MSATARAEARRKAILSRGNDRLAKLTTSARGSDSPVYLPDDLPRTSLSAFVGEDSSSDMPTPRSVSASSFNSMSSAGETLNTTATATSRANAARASPQPQEWSEQEQANLLSAFLSSDINKPLPGFPNANDNNASFPRSRNVSGEGIPFDGSGLPDAQTDPMEALMSQLGMFAPPNGGGGVGMDPNARMRGGSVKSKKQTLGKKLMPLVHLLVMWALLGNQGGNGWWGKWASLARGRSDGWGVQSVPFFWMFATIQMVLHSVWIFSGFDAIQPPALLSLALPHLPAPLPTLITTGFKYVQMGSLFLDDVACLLVGVGILVYLGTWFTT